MGASHDFGDAVDKFVQAHFRSLGCDLGFPLRDSGVDFLIRRIGGPWQGVQVKHLPPTGSVRLRPPKKGNQFPTNEEYRAASAVKRAYDILIICCEEYVWEIPEEATRGTTGITLRSRLTGKWLVKSKWSQYRQERKTWVKHVSAA